MVGLAAESHLPKVLHAAVHHGIDVVLPEFAQRGHIVDRQCWRCGVLHLLPVGVPVGKTIVQGYHVVRSEHETVFLIKHSLAVERAGRSDGSRVFYGVELQAEHRLQPAFVVVGALSSPGHEEVFVVREPGTVAHSG